MQAKNKFSPDKPYNDLPLLPPQKEKVETIAVLKQESKAAVALAELKGLAKTLSNQSILINGIVLKEAKASSEIENVITTHDKLYQALILKDNNVDGATKEVLRYREALIVGYNYINQKGFLNTNGIIKVQRELEENDAGIRKLPGTALKNDLTNEIIYTPPDNQEAIQKLMKNFDGFINNADDDIAPLIKMAIQHYQFESIHPFYDGNGRTGRIVNVLYLLMNGLLDIPILFLSGYIIKHKNDYYRLLREVTTKGNWEEWILYILTGIEQTAHDTIKQIEQINKLFNATVEKTKREAPKVYSKELIEALFEQPYCRIEFLMQHLDCSRRSASTYLNTLAKAGIIESKIIGRDGIFINTALFNLFKK
jgi:Fic family protein